MQFDPINDIVRRPPFVEFYEDVVVDVNASKTEGRQMMKSTDFIRTRAIGSKDDFIQQYDDWIKHQRVLAKNGQIEKGWVPYFEQRYKEYKATGNTPVNGMPIEQWAQINKGQALNLKAQNCHSVEDLAEWPDGNLQNLGMGARALKESAVAWLKSAKQGKAAAEIEALTVANKEKDATIIKLMLRLEALEQRMYEADEPTPRKRVRKEDATAQE